MKLYYTKRSPYASKVRAVAQERALNLDLVEIADLTNKPAELLAANPLGKIPALVLDDGTSLFDSPVICQYLDTLGDREKLIPHKGSERYRVLKVGAAADGIMDACVAIFMESIRPEALRSDAVVTRHVNAIERVLDYFDKHPNELEGNLHLGMIAMACALGYLNLRFQDLISWQTTYPNLNAWHHTMLSYQSIHSVIPRIT